MPLEIGEIPGGGRPFGGIYDVETPALDRITQQLQQQKAARQAYEQKESQNTDELLNKEMANVRSIDTPQVINAYNNYKQLKKKVLFDKSLQNNPKAYNAAQMESNAAYANAMSLINKSTQANAFGKQVAANRLAKPDAYDDNAGQMLSTFYNTPIDKLNSVDKNGQPTDLMNVDSYRYKAGNADFQKIHTAAAGKPVTHYDNGQTDESGIQTTQHGYSYGNTPGQYRNVYLSGLAGNQANRGARYNWSQKSQQDLDSLDAAYQNSPNWQKLGMQPQQLPPYNPNDPVGNEATFQAKQYLVNMNPAEVKASVTTNQGAKMDLQQQQKIQMEGVKHLNRVAEIADRFANSKSLVDYKFKKTDPEGTTPTVDNIQDLLEHPAQKFNGKTAAQLSQDVLSNWNSQGNTKNIQTKLTVVPSFNTSETKDVKGFNDLFQSGLRSVGDAYNALPKEARTETWGTVLQKFNSATTTQQAKEILSKAYNEINKANGSSVRFTPDDLDKSVPVLHQRREVDDKYDNTKYQVVKAGTPEFSNVINEKRNAVLSSKKPVIQGQENKPDETTKKTISGW